MSDHLVVEGNWPGRLQITRAWARAEARPWNDESAAGQLRLVRGGADFLAEATRVVTEAGGSPVFSPALYPTSTRVWQRSGYRLFDQLVVMERSLMVPWPEPTLPITIDRPVWTDLLAVDHAAFEGFWRMSRLGLAESSAATRRSAVLTVETGGGIAGYAIVGAQRGVGYLQRIAVGPESREQGMGTALVRAAMTWARGQGCRTMILNVRKEATPARDLYHGAGFNTTDTRLEIMRHPGPSQPY
jgi:ribosomal protein S18 acetylase RimI-like enzyme